MEELGRRRLAAGWCLRWDGEGRPASMARKRRGLEGAGTRGADGDGEEGTGSSRARGREEGEEGETAGREEDRGDAGEPGATGRGGGRR